MLILSPNGYLWCILFSYQQLMATRSIIFQIHYNSYKLMKQIIYSQEGIVVLHLHMVEHSKTAHHPTQHLVSIPVQPQLQLDWPDSASPLSDPIFYPTGPTVPIMPTTVVHLSAAAHEAWMVVQREVVILAMQAVLSTTSFVGLSSQPLPVSNMRWRLQRISRLCATNTQTRQSALSQQ